MMKGKEIENRYSDWITDGIKYAKSCLCLNRMVSLVRPSATLKMWKLSRKNKNTAKPKKALKCQIHSKQICMHKLICESVVVVVVVVVVEYRKWTVHSQCHNFCASFLFFFLYLAFKLKVRKKTKREKASMERAENKRECERSIYFGTEL